MEAAIETIKKKIRNMNEDIDLIQRRLDDDIGKIYDDEINPLMIIEEMENVKKDLKKIKSEFENIYEKKKNYIAILHRQMQNYHFLLDVEKKLDAPVKEFESFRRSELLLSCFFDEQIKQLLTSINVTEINKLIGSGTDTTVLNYSDVKNNLIENSSTNCTGNKNEENDYKNKKNERKEALGDSALISKEQNNYRKGNIEKDDLTNAQNKNKSNDYMQNESTGQKVGVNLNGYSEITTSFIPIDEKTFNDVPVLTRRRAKLEDVNRVYKTLYEMAMKAGSCKPVEKLELQHMNLQVFGQTGEAKLATLRYLKIIEIINKTGSVRLLECAGIKKKKKRKGTFLK